MKANSSHSSGEKRGARLLHVLFQLLSPAAWLFGALTTLRNICFDRGLFRIYRSRLPVISIGNISVGGNAKTPLVIFLAQELVRRGNEVVILSRGYGGKSVGPLLVKKDHSATAVGDEPLLIASKTGCPVVIARSRVRGAKFIERNNLGSVILLDDGFQHRWLGRDLDILSIYVGSEESRKEFVRGRLLPVGRFRESRERALRRTDVVIFSERQPAAEASTVEPQLFRLIPGGVQLYRSFFDVLGVYSLQNEERLQACDVVAFCGIANPEGFIQTLEHAGFRIVEAVCFSDHHQFQPQDFERLRSAHPGLPLVCTEKDAQRIPKEGRRGLFDLRIAAKITPADAFVTQVCRTIVQRQKRRNGAVIDLHKDSDVRSSSK